MEQSIKDAIRDPNKLSEVINKLSQNPGGLEEMAGDAIKHIPPELMAEAKKMAAGSSGKDVKKMLSEKGVNLSQVRKMKKQMKTGPPVPAPRRGEVVYVASLITLSRKIKVKNIPASQLEKTLSPFNNRIVLKGEGSLVGKEIIIFHTKSGTENRKISRICGQKVLGEVLVFCRNAPIREAQLIEIENFGHPLTPLTVEAPKKSETSEKLQPPGELEKPQPVEELEKPPQAEGTGSPE